MLFFLSFLHKFAVCYSLVTVPLWALASAHQRGTMRRRRNTASPCLTSGRRPTRWSLSSGWSPECATTSMATLTPTSNPCFRGTSLLHCQVHILAWMSAYCQQPQWDASPYMFCFVCFFVIRVKCGVNTEVQKLSNIWRYTLFFW